MRARKTALALAIALASLLPQTAFADAGAGAYAIELLGEPSGIVNEADDLFAHIPPLAPGESGQGHAVICNKADASQRVWLAVDDWAAAEDGPAAELLDRITVRIAYDGETVYEGAVRGEGLREAALLGEIAPGGQAELAYVLTASPDLDADAESLTNAVRWTLAAEDLSEAPSDTLPGASGIVQTGDGALGLATGATALACAGVLGMRAIYVSRKEVRS